MVPLPGFVPVILPVLLLHHQYVNVVKKNFFLVLLLKQFWPIWASERVPGLPRNSWTTLWGPLLCDEFELNWPIPAVTGKCGAWKIPADLNKRGSYSSFHRPWACGSSKAESPSYPCLLAGLGGQGDAEGLGELGYNPHKAFTEG